MIITISREFGSGGRELGKRLSEALGIPCYDHEIIEMIAKEHGFDERYVSTLSEKSILSAYPMTIGNRFSVAQNYLTNQVITVAVEQRKIIESLAKQGDCVIVGRCADVILAEHKPFNIFVYADEDAKINRCIERSADGEKLTRQKIKSMMRKIDKQRAEYRSFYSDKKWGSCENYHLCVNTSGREIKSLIPGLCEYIRRWFAE